MSTKAFVNKQTGWIILRIIIEVSDVSTKLICQ